MREHKCQTDVIDYEFKPVNMTLYVIAVGVDRVTRKDDILKPLLVNIAPRKMWSLSLFPLEKVTCGICYLVLLTPMKRMRVMQCEFSCQAN